MHFLICLSSNFAGIVELCISKNPMFFVFFHFNVFWRENGATRLSAKLKFQDMATQINNLKISLTLKLKTTFNPRRDRIECEKYF